MYTHKYMTQTRKHGHMHRDIRRSTWYMETDGRHTERMACRHACRQQDRQTDT